MRYIVIGAGAIGGTLGGRLAQHGHEVVLVARGAHADRLAEHGLRLLTPTGPVEVQTAVARGPEDVVLTTDDVLVLAVKVQDAAGLLADWAAAPVHPHAPDAAGTTPQAAEDGAGEGLPGATAGELLPVVCAQNGVEGERLAQRWFRRVVGACLYLPASHLEPGVVVSEGVPVSGVLVLGRYPAGSDGIVEQVAADLAGSGFAARVSDDVMAAKRGKLLDNTGNAVDAVCRPGPGWEELRADARQEARTVLEAARLPALDRAAAFPGYARLGFRTAPVAGAERPGSSSWQSLRRGGSVETDWLNGEIVLLGRRHGVPVPVNEALQVLADVSARRGTGPRAFDVADVRRLALRLAPAAAAGRSPERL